MVDYVERATGTGDIHPDEELLAACNFTPSPISVRNAGMTGGPIAGGVAGMAIGAASDRYLARTEAGEAAVAELRELVMRPEHEVTLHPNDDQASSRVGDRRSRQTTRHDLRHPAGSHRSGGVGRIRGKALRGKAPATLVWFGVGETVLLMAAISGGPNRTCVQAVIGALETRLPGRVSRFEA